MTIIIIIIPHVDNCKSTNKTMKQEFEVQDVTDTNLG